MPHAIPFGARTTADQVLAGVDLTGRRIVVTGCGSGIGFETMSSLAANGAHVIGMARTLDLAAAACARGGISCTPVECDLADLDSIFGAARILRGMDVPLDAIVTDAGMARVPDLRTRYGIEMQFLVNYIGHFALLNELAGSVRDGTGRIVIVSGDAGIDEAPAGGISFDNLDGSLGYDALAFHGQSKLALAVYARELSQRLSGRGIAVNSVNPGSTRNTGLDEHHSWGARLMRRMRTLFMKSAQQGAATQSLLAASPRAMGITGEHWTDCRIGQGSPWLEDRDVGGHLWEISTRIVETHRSTPQRALQAAA